MSVVRYAATRRYTSLTPIPVAMLPRGDSAPFGIISTPVYNPQAGFVVVVAEVPLTGPAHMLTRLSWPRA